MDIRPIRNETDNKAAITRISSLWDAVPGTPEADELDILATLVSAFEDDRYPAPDADPIDAIKAHMDLSGHTQNDLAAILGSRSRASEILNRRRVLNLQMVHAIVMTWKIPAELLIKPYSIKGQVGRSSGQHRVATKRGGRATSVVTSRKRALA